MGMMAELAEKVKALTHGEKILVISATIPRAVESVAIVTKNLNLSAPETFPELYASEEDNLLPDINKAVAVINSFENRCDVLVVIASREYIEVLPKYFIKEPETGPAQKTQLKRGEAVVLDRITGNISYL
jgi:hypothetical protein